MKIQNFEITKNENHTLSGLGFHVTFPDIIRIQHEPPVLFQEQLRNEGYPEFAIDNLEAGRVFIFSSEDNEWEIFLAKNSIALIYNGISLDYVNFKEHLHYALNTFCQMYSPAYFNTVRFLQRHIINTIIFPKLKLESFIPSHIFPELSSSSAEDFPFLGKQLQLFDNEINVDATFSLESVSGTFVRKRLIDEKSYRINIDCSYEQNIKELDDAITRFDELKQTAWNIFQWSITDALRKAMVEIK